MIEPSDIRRSALRRFLPGSLAALGIAFLFTGIPPIGLPVVLLLGGQILGLTAGYAIALRCGRRFVRSRKVLVGKRAVLTGAVSIPTLAFVLAFFEGRFVTLPSLVLAATGLAGLTGAYVGAAMFLRKPRKPEPIGSTRAERLESGESLEDWFETQEREADLLYRDRPHSAA